MSNCSNGQCDTSQGQGEQEDIEKIKQERVEYLRAYNSLAREWNRDVKKSKGDRIFTNILAVAIVIGFLGFVYLR